MRTPITRLAAFLIPFMLAALAPEPAEAAPTFKTFSGSITTEATVAQAAADKTLVVYNMVVRSSGAGVVVFRDGTAGTTIMNLYLAADTNYQIGPDFFTANGMQLTSRTLTAELSGATLTILMRTADRDAPSSGAPTFKTASTSISTEATIAQAAASHTLVVYSMQVRSSGAGVVVFRDGTAGTTIMNLYLAADTPTQIPPEIFTGNGMQLASRNLTAELSGATLTVTMRTADRAAPSAMAPTFKTFSDTITSETTIAQAAADHTLTVYNMVARTSAGVAVTFRDDTAGTTLAIIYFAANTTTVIPPEIFTGNGLQLTTRTLTAEASAASSLTIFMRTADVE